MCIGTEMAMTRARASFCASSGSTETSISAGRYPARSRKAAGQATASGWWPIS